MLSPRVAFLDQQRLLLNVDNSALKQRIATLSQDKIFKDGNQTKINSFFFLLFFSDSFLYTAKGLKSFYYTVLKPFHYMY